jgi:hypothetical protein
MVWIVHISYLRCLTELWPLLPRVSNKTVEKETTKEFKLKHCFNILFMFFLYCAEFECNWTLHLKNC